MLGCYVHFASTYESWKLNWVMSLLDTFWQTCSMDPNIWSLQWRHDGRDTVSNHQPHDCLLNRLFRRRSKKTSKFRVTGLCAGNSSGIGEFPAQRASNAENVSIWWRHHDPNDSKYVIMKQVKIILVQVVFFYEYGLYCFFFSISGIDIEYWGLKWHTHEKLYDWTSTTCNVSNSNGKRSIT